MKPKKSERKTRTKSELKEMSDWKYRRFGWLEHADGNAGVTGWTASRKEDMTEKGKVATFIWRIFRALCQGAQIVRISRNHLKIVDYRMFT